MNRRSTPHRQRDKLEIKLIDPYIVYQITNTEENLIMSNLDINTGQIVAHAPETARSVFIKKTYLHVAGAFAVYAALLFVFLNSGLGDQMMGLLARSRYSWLIVLGAWMFISYVAENWAHSSVSRATQYVGLALYTVGFALLSLPLMYMASRYAPGILQNAIIVTFALSAGITFTAFTTRKDFSFMGPFLKIGGMVAFGTIIASILFGFSLGTLFAGAMVLFFGGAILYTTSNIIHHYHTEQYVAASLSLFSSIGMLLWYVIQFMMSMAGGD